MPSRKPHKVREPIQVYLTADDRALLDRAAKSLGVPRAEVLRLGLRRVGEAATGRNGSVEAFLEEMNEAPWPEDMPANVAARHDDQLASAHGTPKGARRKP